MTHIIDTKWPAKELLGSRNSSIIDHVLVDGLQQRQFTFGKHFHVAVLNGIFQNDVVESIATDELNHGEEIGV